MKTENKFKKNSLSYILLMLVFLGAVSGCSKFTKIDATKIDRELMDRPAGMSSVNDSAAKSARVVIRIKKPIGSDKKSKKYLLNRLRQGFDRELGKHSRKIVDRGLNRAVRSEIELAQIYGKKSGRLDADYIMMIALDEYVTHQKSEVVKGALGKGKFYTCHVSAEYKGWVRVLTVPSIERLTQWEISGSRSTSIEESSPSRCKASYKKRLKVMRNEMIENTLCESETDYLNALASSGHVLSINHRKDDVLYETSLNTRVNGKKGDVIYFYHELSDKPYAEGEVVLIDTKKSWVKLKGLGKNETVYKNDWVRPHDSGMMSRMKCMF